MDVQAADPFRDFLRTILTPTIPTEYINAILMDAPINAYFKKAFTHKTFTIGTEDSEFNYEVLEKVGDRIYNMFFQLWTYETIGQETNVLQVYSNIEKRFVGTEYLSELADNIGLGKFIKAAPGVVISDKIKEDVFEALVAAICLSVDEYAVKELGIVMAKSWLYQIFNTFTRAKIDPQNSASLVDFRSRVNEVYQINAWGTPIYLTAVNSKAAAASGVQGFAAVDLRAPNRPNFPAKFRGKVIGSGTGKNLTEAKEKASEEALKLLGVNYAEVNQFEVVFERLNLRRIERALVDHPDVVRRLKVALDKVKDVYQEIAIKTVKIAGEFVSQLRVSVEGIWKNDARGKGDTKVNSMINVIEYFISKIDKGQINV